MTKGLEEALNLPSLEDALKQHGLHPKQGDETQSHPEPEELDEELEASEAAYDQEALEELSRASQEQIQDAQSRIRKIREVSGEDHSRAMDEIHDEGLRHARDLMDLGFNIDHARARGIFEQAANFYKIAMDSKNSKRDMQIKALRLALDQRKLELEEKKLMGAEAVDEATPVQQGAVLVEDRNELLRRWRENRRKD